MSMKIFNSKKALNEAAIDFDGLLEINDEVRGRLQQVLLGMYKDLKTYCDSIGVRLYLIGGTALGAVRHGGFIPWDDDFDLGISRKDYFKLRNSFEASELSDRYILNAPNYSEEPKARFPQFIKKGTLFEEIGVCTDDAQLKGIKIDIFIIENVPDNHVVRLFKGLICNFMEFITSKVQNIENPDIVGKELWLRASRTTYYLNRLIGKVFSIVRSKTWLGWIDSCAQNDNEKSKFCSIPTSRKHYFGEILPREVFFPPKKVTFCGELMDTVHDPHAYLKNLYGDDYMDLPPVNKRERHFIKKIDFGDDN